MGFGVLRLDHDDLSVLSLSCHARGDRLKEEALMPTEISSRRRYTSDEISNVYQEISGTTDIATLFWIGSAIEFAFHKDVDWLFFSQGLLQDPLLRVGRDEYGPYRRSCSPTPCKNVMPPASWQDLIL